MYTFYILFGFCVARLGGLTVDEALKVAECLAPCLNETCRESCNSTENMIHDYPNISQAADASISLHCRGMHSIMIKHNPGTYVVEQSVSDSDWDEPILTSGRWTKFSNLTSGSLYRYRFRRLTRSGLTRQEVSEWFDTFTVDHVPGEVKRISLADLQADDRDVCQLRARIEFEPAEDRSCNYDVLSYSGGHNLLNFYLIEPPKFSFVLSQMAYDQNTTVSILSSNDDNTRVSNRTQFVFATPSCVDFHNNYSICGPQEVKDFEVKAVQKHGSVYDLLVIWNATNWAPHNYTIQITSSNEPVEHHIAVPGNVTEVHVPDIALGPQYEVSIFVESVCSISVGTLALRTDAETTDLFHHEIVYIVPTLMMIIVLGGGIFLGCGKDKDKHDNASCKNFESLQCDFIKTAIKESLGKDNAAESDAFLTDDKFELSPEQLTLKDVLGIGAYGIVRLGSLKDDIGGVTDVAVKMIKDNPTMEDIKNFQQEILMMKSAGRHSNIVSLIGYCTLHGSPLLVVEYCRKGDLQTYLRAIWENIANVIVEHRNRFVFGMDGSDDTFASNRFDTFDTREAQYENARAFTNRAYGIQQDLAVSTENTSATDLLNFARQVAIGMEFLSFNRIVHRDLAARNVLLCADKVVKISDFGLSRDIYQENVYKKQGNGKLPIKWMAIEALTHQVYTTHSDVWSFGILLWEIVTLGGMPYPGTSTSQILPLLKSGYRMERPSNCGIELYKLMHSCWNAKPRKRPTFTELKHSLDKFICHHSENEYLILSDDPQGSSD